MNLLISLETSSNNCSVRLRHRRRTIDREESEVEEAEEGEHQREAQQVLPRAVREGEATSARRRLRDHAADDGGEGDDGQGVFSEYSCGHGR